MRTEHPLDNPIWSALTTRQAHFAETFNQARRFPLDVTSLGGFDEPSRERYASLAALQSAGGPTGLFLADRTSLPSGWTIVDEAPLLQMAREVPQAALPVTVPVGAPGWIELTEQDVPDMVELAGITKPGPFGKRTRELGAYIGIRREGKLVAMAGERLRVPGYSEISAVCTHPEYVGQGFAARLMNALVGMIVSRREVPFLHVRATNQRAIELYRRLGFADRLLFRYVSVCKPAGQTRTAS
jgi:ribosomal protein S18 acetylase RimI-like enzyme